MLQAQIAIHLGYCLWYHRVSLIKLKLHWMVLVIIHYLAAIEIGSVCVSTPLTHGITGSTDVHVGNLVDLFVTLFDVTKVITGAVTHSIFGKALLVGVIIFGLCFSANSLS